MRWKRTDGAVPGRRPIAIGEDITQALWNVSDRQPLFDAIRASSQYTERDVWAEGWTLHSFQVKVPGEDGRPRMLNTGYQRITVHLDAIGAKRWQRALRETGVIA